MARPGHRFCYFVLLWALGSGCTNYIEKYIERHPHLPAQRIMAMRVGTVINGMDVEEVRLVMGKPTFVEKPGGSPKKIRWIYRDISGIRADDAYAAGSSFPQGIGYVIPLDYQYREIRIDFQDDKVCRVEKILSF